MEQGFGNDIEKKKLGGGIITLAVLTFVFSAFGLISNIFSLSKLDETNKTLESMGMATISSTQIIISIAVAVIEVVGFILILRWKKLGVYMYYAAIVLSLITTFMFSSATGAMGVMLYVGVAIGLIIPILLAIFLRRKFKYFE